MSQKRKKTIVLSELDAMHAYEWLRMYWRGERNRFGGCYQCERIGRRLERAIGPGATRRIAALVRKHPGETPSKKRESQRSNRDKTRRISNVTATLRSC